MRLQHVYDYFRSYDKSEYQVVACAGSEPTEKDIATFERTIGRRLPTDFREFTMSSLGGLYMEVREELWPRIAPFQVGPFWSFLRGIKVFGIANGIPDWLDLRCQYRQLSDAGYPALLPFLQVAGDANLYCFDADDAIVFWDHEASDELALVEKTFPDLLLSEIAELDIRKIAKLNGDDKSGIYAPDYVRQQQEKAPTIPCPKCGKPLRTAVAKQCFACGADWH